MSETEDGIHVHFTHSEMSVKIVDGVQLYPPTARLDRAELTELVNGADVGTSRLVYEVRRLQGLLVRVAPLHEKESLAALAAKYGVERAQQWREVLDEAEAIRKEQGA